MFKITAYCQDKKLDRVLWSLVGLVVGKPEIDPIRGEGIDEEGDTPPGTAMRNGPAHPASMEGNLITRVLKYLIANRPEVINSTVLQEAVEAVGGTPSSWTYIVRECRKAGILEGPTSRGVYQLNLAALNKRGGAQEALPAAGAEGRPPMKERVKQKAKGPNSKPFAETLAAKAIGHLIDDKHTIVDGAQIKNALVEAGGSEKSSYYCTLVLKNLGVFEGNKADGTYKINVEKFRQNMQASQGE